MPVYIDIMANLDGVNAVKSGLQSMTSQVTDMQRQIEASLYTPAKYKPDALLGAGDISKLEADLDYRQKDWQRHYDRVFGIQKAGEKDFTLLSAEEAARQENLLGADLTWKEKEWQRHYDKLLNLKKSSAASLRASDFMSAEEARGAMVQKRAAVIGAGYGGTRDFEGAQVGGLSKRQEFIAGQRLQGALTSALGINNPVTQLGNAFERLQYMSEASGVSMGKMLATLGPMAAAATAVAYAWSVGSRELDTTNKQLAEMGFKAINFAQWAGIGLDIVTAESQLKVDPHAMALRTLRQMNQDLDVTTQLEKAIAGNVSMTRAEREAVANRLNQEIPLLKQIHDLQQKIAGVKQTTGTTPLLRDRAEQLEREAAVEERLHKLRTLPATPENLRIDQLERQAKLAEQTRDAQDKLKELQDTPRKVEANTELEIRERIAELQAKTHDLLAEGQAGALAASREALELEERKRQLIDVQARDIQAQQRGVADFWAGMARGDARLPGADVYGSRESVVNRQQLEQREPQQRIAEEQLQKAESAALSLEAIKRILESGQTIGVFTMDGLN